ncbi:hypothetical protein [Ramlibacter sp. H39-3-26]|uniref:hypothetical protein n=1 Tax=Curvibacter soli TaxID=3031331 RepID=UPI0023DBB237|nr:hypothetical protein [Ramlibacter sp. H39-3-26]
MNRARLAEVFPECAQALPPRATQALLKDARRAAELRRVREVLQSAQGDQRQAARFWASAAPRCGAGCAKADRMGELLSKK